MLYLISDFRVWSSLRWDFKRFIVIALGGVVPFLSFIVERYYHRLATADLAEIESSPVAAESNPAQPSSTGAIH